MVRMVMIMMRICLVMRIKWMKTLMVIWLSHKWEILKERKENIKKRKKLIQSMRNRYRILSRRKMIWKIELLK
jgi:hypothetical protein